MVQRAAWTCPSCGSRRKAQFCPACGEERLRSTDLTLADLATQFAKNVSSVDGRLVRSVRCILRRPGVLTARHVAGQRRSYIDPLALFFIANGVFVTLQSLTGAHILSSPLASHLHVQDWRAFARVVVAGRLDEQGRSLADYAPVFDEAVAFNAQFLVILMVLAFAPLPMALFARLRRTVGAHVVFALHLYVFVLVLLCGSLLIAEGQRLLGGGGLASPAVDTTLSIFNLLACGLYIHAALGPAYGSEGVSRIVKAAVLAVATAGIFVGYRFAVFLITLYTT